MFHFVLMPILVINFVSRIVELIRHLDGGTNDLIRLAAGVVIGFAFVLTAFKARTYALKAQDRVIRLEERGRMMTILPEALRPRISELTPGQFVALRFASDGELTELVRAAVDKKLSPKEIKQGIRNWRADDFRV